MCLPGKAGAPPHLLYTHERPEGGACVVVKPWPGLTTTMLATFCPEVSSPLLLSVLDTSVDIMCGVLLCCCTACRTH